MGQNNSSICDCNLSLDVEVADPRAPTVYHQNVCEYYYHGSTPLMAAARFNENLDVFKTLLGAGASVRTKMIANGYHIYNIDEFPSPLLEITDLRIKQQWRKSELKKPSWWRSAAAEETAYIDKIKDHEYGAHLWDKEGKTALMWAAEWNQNPEVIKLLIESGADLNATTASGVTPLMFAAARNNAGVVKALLETDAPGKTINLQYNLVATDADELRKISRFSNALHIACFFSYSEVVNVLLDAGMQPTQSAIDSSKLNNQISDEVRQRLKSALPM